MFTGLIQHVGKVEKCAKRGRGFEIYVDLGPVAKGRKVGDSIAVCGVCLTVESISKRVARFYLSPETLKRTWLGGLQSGDFVNLESAARFGDPIGGHLVQGHVDGVGNVSSREMQGQGEWMEFEVPKDLKPFLLVKGSISVDGISLTIARSHGCRFGVALIPLTLQKTNLQFKKPADPVNLEADLIGRWVFQREKS